MSIGHEFFKEEKFSGNLMENLNFMIDHYYEAIEIYRVMKMQTEINNKKKADAHEALQELREREETIRKSRTKISEVEKLELAEKTELFKKQREDEVNLYYRGNKLYYDQLTHSIIRCEKVLRHVDNVDHWGRNVFGSICKVGSSASLWPLKKMCNITSKQTDSEKSKKLLNKTEQILENLPEAIKNRITREINLKDHLPEENYKKPKAKEGEFEFNISL